MKKRGFLAVLLVMALLFFVTGCGQNSTAQAEANSTQPVETEAPITNTPIDITQNQLDETTDSKVLIAFFSRADENYGVGVVEKGNTQIVAEMIAEETGGDLFHIQTLTPYPADYDACTEVAKQEQADHERPELNSQVQDFDDYDVIYLGYPIWWGDMPMAMYTFLESYDFSGKTMIPFNTHAGSGQAGTVNTIQEICSDSTVLDGMAFIGTDAQNKQDKMKEQVVQWLTSDKAGQK